MKKSKETLRVLERGNEIIGPKTKLKLDKKKKVSKKQNSKLEYVICSHRMDIYAGFLTKVGETFVILENAREIVGVGHSFEKFEMANNGMSVVKGIRFSPEVSKIRINYPSEMIFVKKQVVASIRNEPSYVIQYKD